MNYKSSTQRICIFENITKKMEPWWKKQFYVSNNMNYTKHSVLDVFIYFFQIMYDLIFHVFLQMHKNQ